jgi:peptide/nickel transport system permease protein
MSEPKNPSRLLPRLIRRVIARLVGVVVVLWGAATLAFLVLHLAPGDPVDILLGAQTQATDETKTAIRSEMGLDKPLLVQYLGYLGHLAHGDLGTSYRLGQPVSAVLAQQLPPTIALASSAFVLAVVIALLISLLAHGRVATAIAGLLELVAISSPGFWTGLLLLTVFSFHLHWFPVAGGSGPGGLVLPALTMALPIAGILSQLLRHGLDVAAQQPFVLTARARGLTPAQVTGRHTLRHAALPATTFAAYIVGSLLGGAVIVEQLFGRPGIGRVTLDAVTNRDLPVLMAVVVLAAIVFILVNIVVDLLYPLLDPRLREDR